MNQIIFEQRKLISNFFANIGVAWFAAGVIGIFVNQMTDNNDIFISLAWGLGYSFLFLYLGMYVLKLKARKK